MIIPAKKKYIVVANKWLLKLIRIIQKVQLTLLGDTRPSSYPFISGDSFRALADFVHDETGSFDPAKVKKGDIVFVGNPFMKDYFGTLHKRISNPYILIQHNGDFVVDDSIAELLDEKIICFFAQNTVVEHKKIIPIPIGVTNKYWSVAGMPWTYNRKIITNKIPRIFFSFSPETNPKEREPAILYLKNHKCTDRPENFLAANEHTKLLNRYAFIASPPGQGPESARTWEALYMRTIPITKPFVGINYFTQLGLPIWTLRNWNELDNMTEKDLKDVYKKMIDNADFSALYMDFWIKRINACRIQGHA